MTLLNPEDRASNRLLVHLPQEDQERLRQFLEPVELEYKHPLYNADERIEFVHFIESGVGSLVCTMADGRAAEVGTVGNEGLAGLPVLFGHDRAPSSMYVQVPGKGLEDCACECYAVAKAEFDRLLGNAGSRRRNAARS